jgi:hypothetical protein
MFRMISPHNVPACALAIACGSIMAVASHLLQSALLVRSPVCSYLGAVAWSAAIHHKRNEFLLPLSVCFASVRKSVTNFNLGRAKKVCSLYSRSHLRCSSDIPSALYQISGIQHSVREREGGSSDTFMIKHVSSI